MTNLKKQAFGALAASALLVQMAMPAFAESSLNLTVTGNGADTENEVKFETTRQTNVVQDNDATINTKVNVSNSTGNNDANKNTAGDVTIDTGNADTTVNVSNAANTNHATVDCCAPTDTTVEVSGNGDGSENKVKLDQDNKVKLYQTNSYVGQTDVNTKTTTGNNDANRNTGGSVEIITGDATSHVSVSNAANMNSARVGGDGQGGSLSALIKGNGADSYNKIKLDLDSEVLLTQANDGYINSDVDVKDVTGKNDANRNTDGDVTIDTGNITSTVDVDNMANFNAADLDCGCVLDATAKIAMNGDESENEIKGDVDDKEDVFQNNAGVLLGDLDVKDKTGYNEASKNTGDPEDPSDPSITTGDSSSTVTADNAANVNSLGEDHEMPEVDFDFDWSDVLHAFGF